MSPELWVILEPLIEQFGEEIIWLIGTLIQAPNKDHVMTGLKTTASQIADVTAAATPAVK